MLDSEKYQETVYSGFQGQAKHINSFRDASLIVYRRAAISLLECVWWLVVWTPQVIMSLSLLKKEKKDFHISSYKIAQCLCYEYVMAYITMK